jgi:D-proline reductase (dithiol) PrdB
VPRFLFQDFPLGNPLGVPYDSEMQRTTMGMALDLLETAVAPQTTVQTPFAWPGEFDWRANYMSVDETNIEALRQAGRERREKQARRRSEGRTRTT